MSQNARLMRALKALHDLPPGELDAVRRVLNGDSSSLERHGIDAASSYPLAPDPSDEGGVAGNIGVAADDEPHPARDPNAAVGPGFHVETGDEPTGEGYYPGEPGEEMHDVRKEQT